jgi:hypothetical protein
MMTLISEIEMMEQMNVNLGGSEAIFLNPYENMARLSVFVRGGNVSVHMTVSDLRRFVAIAQETLAMIDPVEAQP